MRRWRREESDFVRSDSALLAARWPSRPRTTRTRTPGHLQAQARAISRTGQRSRRGSRASPVNCQPLTKAPWHPAGVVMHTLVTGISPWFMTAAQGLLFVVRFGLWPVSYTHLTLPTKRI